MNRRLHPVDVIRVDGTSAARGTDAAAAEEPLEIRLQGSPFLVTMRTPGADRELAAGLLLSERIISGPDDLGTIRHCAGTDDAAEGNVLDVTVTGAATARAEEALSGRRLVGVNAACGVCGRRSIDDLMEQIPRLADGYRVPAALVTTFPARLRGAQAVFEQTGGLHAAGLFDRDGELRTVAEDVGRHNAVDKAVGSQLLAERWPIGDVTLFVSGRTSFEIVQKAATAGIPIVAAVSAPSSLAVELARAANLTLLGFVRGGTFNIYAGAERIVL